MSRQFIADTLKLCSAGLILLLISGWLQDFHPAFDSPSHFRLHFAALLAIVSILLLFVRGWIWTLAGLVIIAISVGLTHPYLPGVEVNSGQAQLSKSNDETGDQTNVLRLVQMNLRFINTQYRKAIKVISGAEPDIILLQEITRINEKLLEDFIHSHPHQVYCHRQGIGSVAILSRYPFSAANRNQCLWRLGFARAEVLINGRPFNLASLHSRWPWPFSQSRQLQALRGDMEALSHPAILAGDFNSAPWSAAVSKTANITGTKVAPGLLMSWGSPFAAFRQHIGPVLPIDHVLISPQLGFLSREILEDGGSDHFPILTRIKIR
ncbi:MAG: hypothetical protein GKR97_05215 [Rhizobiaceae bacterium]|nr:hypothetical protein [Rhizobiaceae bacterium]